MTNRYEAAEQTPRLPQTPTKFRVVSQCTLAARRKDRQSELVERALDVNDKSKGCYIFNQDGVCGSIIKVGSGRPQK